MKRASWDETWQRVAEVIAQRSPCVRARAGAVIVDSANRIIATGYNGFPAGRRTSPGQCNESVSACPRALHGPRDSLSYSDCFSIHAEANALLFVDRRLCEGGTIYITTNLCWDCAKLVANSGITRVVMRTDAEYRPVGQVLDLLASCSISVDAWTA